MLHLLKVEWLKVKYYRAFWVFMGLYLIGLFGANYITYQFQIELKKSLPLELFPYNFPKVYQTINWISSWLLYFPGMLIALLISNEYSFKTHRQNIIDGWSRKQFITSKILVVVTLSAFITLITTIIAIAFGLSFSSSFSFEGSEFIAYGFLQNVCYLSFVMLLAVLLRRSGLSMAIFFVYGLIFEQLIGGTIDRWVFNHHYFWYYMPLQVSDVLVPSSFRMINIYKDAPSSTVFLFLTIAYSCLYFFISFKKFEKDDL